MTKFASFETVKVELEGGVAVLTIQRPKALNALNRQVIRELGAALGELAELAKPSADGLRCLVLTGAGEKAFVAGADIAEMATMSVEEALAFSQDAHQVARAIETFPVPVLGAVNGFALGGGCELALCCDVIYAAEGAKFGQPEVKLGLIPGFGGTVRLQKRIGFNAASEWIYTGRTFNAQEAYALGLVREVVPNGQLLEHVREVARLIGAQAPLAIQAAKRSLRGAFGGEGSESAHAVEQREFAALFASEDMREGTSAFVEKRSPVYRGK